MEEKALIKAANSHENGRMMRFCQAKVHMAPILDMQYRLFYNLMQLDKHIEITGS